MTGRFNFGKATWLLRILAALVSFSVPLVLGEICLRRLYRDNLSSSQDERCLMYRYDQTLGWFPRPGTTNRFTASRTITVAHNSVGFRGPEPRPTARPRVIFLGDSFVWGYDVEASERFTEMLQAKHPDWAIENLGVSGYGTDQEFLLLQRQFDRYKPAAVFLMFCSDTDHEDNATNMRVGNYFKPHFALSGEALSLEGVPVPRSERAFWAEHEWICRSYLVRMLVRVCYQATTPRSVHHPDPSAEIILAMQNYVDRKGALFCVGVEGPHPALEEFLDACKIPFVDLTLELNSPYRYPSFGAHWTPEGHLFVCNRIDELLRGLGGVLPELRPAPASPEAKTDALAFFHCRFAGTRNRQGKTREAIEHYRQALRLRPASTDALNNLAWLLASHPDPRFRNGEEAIVLAERACELTGQSQAIMLGTLGAAYAEGGRFAEAAAAGEKARRLASAAGNDGLAERNGQLLELYRVGKAYREAPEP